jgi:hypothetical protein
MSGSGGTEWHCPECDCLWFSTDADDHLRERADHDDECHECNCILPDQRNGASE